MYTTNTSNIGVQSFYKLLKIHFQVFRFLYHYLQIKNRKLKLYKV